jgi:hypothetical protein
MTRRSRHTLTTVVLVLTGGAAVVLPMTTVASAAEVPVKEILSSHVGWEVDKTTGKNLCTIESNDICQLGKLSSQPGGFEFPESVAVNNDPASSQHNDLYISDGGNQRVQILTPTGGFVSMFGWDVNKTKEKEAEATQAERNICTGISGDTCQAGKDGSATGQFSLPQSVAVDPGTGNIYVQDFLNSRVQEFTETGKFVLMFGKSVDETTGGNVCTAISKDKCRSGEFSVQGSMEPGAFKFAQNYGNLLAVGGPGDLLYVGDEHRVQEFTSGGVWVGEISLTSVSSAPGSRVVALAIDSIGDVYLDYEVNSLTNMIREFNPKGEELKSIVLVPRESAASSGAIEVRSMALDAAGRLAVSEHETGSQEGHSFSVFRGGLYEFAATSPFLLTEFPTEFGGTGASLAIAFNEKDEMYVVDEQEFDGYHPVSVAELLVEPSSCKEAGEVETSVTFECLLQGLVNPESVPLTEVWFDWGKTTVLGSKTPVQEEVPIGNTLVLVSAPLAGLRPNETYYYRLEGYDENVKLPESALASERTSFTTPVVTPKIVGEPSAQAIAASSAVVFAELNPEHAKTEYWFEYGLEGQLKTCSLGARLENCPGVLSTPAAQSNLYGVTGTTFEVRGLQPASSYGFRLSIEYENEAKTGKVATVPGPLGTFTTAFTPTPQATTGLPTAIGTTSAIISGTVNPNGPQAAYSFELGIYNGTATRYGTVYSGSVAAGTIPVPESLSLTGLQPGTTYAYKIIIKSGYINNPSNTIEGEPVTFRTAGVPTILNLPVPLAQLPIPSTLFPTSSSPTKTKVKHKKPRSRKTKGHKRNNPHYKHYSNKKKNRWGRHRQSGSQTSRVARGPRNRVR